MKMRRQPRKKEQIPLAASRHHYSYLGSTQILHPWAIVIVPSPPDLFIRSVEPPQHSPPAVGAPRIPTSLRVKLWYLLSLTLSRASSFNEASSSSLTYELGRMCCSEALRLHPRRSPFKIASIKGLIKRITSSNRCTLICVAVPLSSATWKIPVQPSKTIPTKSSSRY